MYARVTRMEVPIDRLDEDVALTDEIANSVAETPGSRGLYYMVDRQTGKTMAITLWKTEQDMHDSEALASQNSQKRITHSSAIVVSVESYEVAQATFPLAQAM